jgi:hypothetical protein
MNVPEDYVEKIGYDQNFKSMESIMKRTFGKAETIISTDTYQFEDYSKYEASGFNEEQKAKRRAEVFPVDCKKAFDMGARFAGKIKEAIN